MATPNRPATAGPRVPRIGEIVWYAHHPHQSADDALEVCPAVVLRVNSPGDPRSNLGLAVLSLTDGLRTPFGAPHSETLRLYHWSFPGDEQPTPYFRNSRDQDVSTRPFEPNRYL